MTIEDLIARLKEMHVNLDVVLSLPKGRFLVSEVHSGESWVEFRYKTGPLDIVTPQCMTVGELIATLQGMPPDWNVVLMNNVSPLKAYCTGVTENGDREGWYVELHFPIPWAA